MPCPLGDAATLCKNREAHPHNWVIVVCSKSINMMLYVWKPSELHSLVQYLTSCHTFLGWHPLSEIITMISLQPKHMHLLPQCISGDESLQEKKNGIIHSQCHPKYQTFSMKSSYLDLSLSQCNLNLEDSFLFQHYVAVFGVTVPMKIRLTIKFRVTIKRIFRSQIAFTCTSNALQSWNRCNYSLNSVNFFNNSLRFRCVRLSSAATPVTSSLVSSSPPTLSSTAI